MTPTDELKKAAREYAITTLMNGPVVSINSDRRDAFLAGAQYQDPISREAGRAEVLALLRNWGSTDLTTGNISDAIEAKLRGEK